MSILLCYLSQILLFGILLQKIKIHFVNLFILNYNTLASNKVIKMVNYILNNITIDQFRHLSNNLKSMLKIC